MGFGILFFGYIILSFFSLNPFGDVAQLIGFSVSLFALIKLSIYAKNFVFAKYTTMALVLSSAFSSVVLICKKVGVGFTLSESFDELFSLAFAILFFAFHLFLLFGIREIAKFTELPKIANKALRNFIVGAFYLLLTVIGSLNTPFKEDFAKYFGIPTLLIGLVWYALNIILIYSCYMWICLEGDEDMERKKSRFEFVNKFYDAFDKKEEEAIRSTIEYAHSKKRKKKKK